MIDILIRHLEKPGHSYEEDKYQLDAIKGLIMSPTRELAIQIKDHIEAIIPTEFQRQIKVCVIVGGMSV